MTVNAATTSAQSASGQLPLTPKLAPTQTRRRTHAGK
jgi:hypothetical protein